MARFMAIGAGGGRSGVYYERVECEPRSAGQSIKHCKFERSVSALNREIPMGLRFRRSIKIAPGIRLNLNKKSAGLTIGPRGAKYTLNTRGQKRMTVGLPGTGRSYTASPRRTSSKPKTVSLAGPQPAPQRISSVQDSGAANEAAVPSRHWYQQSWGIILLLVLFFPIGLVLIWTSSPWSLRTKRAVTQQPAEAPFHNPPAGQHDESDGVVTAFDDGDPPGPAPCAPICEPPQPAPVWGFVMPGRLRGYRGRSRMAMRSRCSGVSGGNESMTDGTCSARAAERSRDEGWVVSISGAVEVSRACSALL